MTSLNATARRAGISYLVMAMLMIFAYLYVPGALVVATDAAATARNITERALLFRTGMLAALISQILFIFVVLTLYELFKDVDRSLARLMLALVCVGVAVEIVNLGARAAPLVLLTSQALSPAFSRPQLDGLAFSFMRVGNGLGQVVMMLWGLWLIPFGRLVIKSGFLPRVLGVLLYIAGVAYMAGAVIYLMLPAYYTIAGRIIMPLALGELGIVFWLALAGLRPRAGGAMSGVSQV